MMRQATRLAKRTRAATRRTVKAHPLTAIGLVASILTLGFTGFQVTVGTQRYEVRLLGKQEQAGLAAQIEATRDVTWRACEQAYAKGQVKVVRP